MTDDSDDFGFRLEHADVEVLADRILAGKVLARKGGVELPDRARVFIIVLAQQARALQGDAHFIGHPRVIAFSRSDT